MGVDRTAGGCTQKQAHLQRLEPAKAGGKKGAEELPGGGTMGRVTSFYLPIPGFISRVLPVVKFSKCCLFLVVISTTWLL